MKTKALLCCLTLTVLAACNKVPESQAAKDVGNIPKQTLDRATSGTEKAMQQNADRNKDADDKKQ
jgi:hypothetical protein